MNQISPLLKLHPKLYMLIHAGQHLLKLSQSLAQQSEHVFSYTSSHPVQWHLMLPQKQSLRQTHVRSSAPLQLPAFAGLPAAIEGLAIETIKPNCLYQLPNLIFELLDPDDKPVRELDIFCGHYQSPNNVIPERQLLEYGASLIQYEIAEWGFRCLRKKNQLVFEGHGLLAGWNLRIKSVMFPETELPLCDLGLSTGLSSLMPGQQKGRYSNFHWGPWEINQQICQITLPFDDPEEFARHFCDELNRIVNPIGITAFWDPENHLVLSHQQAGQTIEIKRLEAMKAKGIHRNLELEFPVGIHGVSGRLNWSAFFELNHYPIQIEQCPDELALAKSFLLQTINACSDKTRIQVELTADDFLIFKSLSSRDKLLIEKLSESAQHALGLQPICLDHSAFDEFKNASERWLKMFNQFLFELPPDIEQNLMLHQVLKEIPSEIAIYNNDNQMTWTFVAHQQDYLLFGQALTALLTCLEKGLEISSQQMQQRFKPLQLEIELSQTPGSHVLGQNEAIESANLSRFDHKI